MASSSRRQHKRRNIPGIFLLPAAFTRQRRLTSTTGVMSIIRTTDINAHHLHFCRWSLSQGSASCQWRLRMITPATMSGIFTWRGRCAIVIGRFETRVRLFHTRLGDRSSSEPRYVGETTTTNGTTGKPLRPEHIKRRTSLHPSNSLLNMLTTQRWLTANGKLHGAISKSNGHAFSG